MPPRSGPLRHFTPAPPPPPHAIRYITPNHMMCISKLQAVLNRCYPEFGIIEDDTPSFAEAKVIIMTVVTRDTFEALELLVRVRFLKKSLNAEDSAAILEAAIEDKSRCNMRLLDMRSAPTRIPLCRSPRADPPNPPAALIVPAPHRADPTTGEPAVPIPPRRSRRADPAAGEPTPISRACCDYLLIPCANRATGHSWQTAPAQTRRL